MDDDEESKGTLRSAVLEVVENQIRDNDPPETRQTFERLKREGHSPEEARRLIGSVVAIELFHIMRDHREFDRKRFVWNLAQLPGELCDKDGNGLY